MFKDVFAPKSGEKVLFMVDKPHDDIVDNLGWKARREMANDWYNSFKNMGVETGFSVDMFEFDATGVHNTPIPKDVIDRASKFDLVIAMTEFSGSSSFLKMCRKEGAATRCASMPIVEKRMEDTALRANYADVQVYANSIKKLLTNAVGAEVLFSTGDRLFIDLRNRVGYADGGVCRKPGQTINFPSGEGYIAPYEGIGDEIKELGESKTVGILPDNQHGDLLKYVVKNNRIAEVVGDGENADEMRRFFEENDTRRNIAELGIGCNPEAVVTGNILEDEKVSGLHIAYGMNTQFGGKVDSDTHIDICFPKGLPAAAQALTLINKDGLKTELIKDSQLRYDLLR